LLAPVKNFIPKNAYFFNITIKKLSKNFQEPKTLLPLNPFFNLFLNFINHVLILINIAFKLFVLKYNITFTIKFIEE